MTVNTNHGVVEDEDSPENHGSCRENHGSCPENLLYHGMEEEGHVLLECIPLSMGEDGRIRPLEGRVEEHTAAKQRDDRMYCRVVHCRFWHLLPLEPPPSFLRFPGAPFRGVE